MKVLKKLIWLLIFLASNSFACPVDHTKLQFVGSCSAYLRFWDTQTQSDKSVDSEQALCRCVANNFSVEAMADKDCYISSDAVEAILRLERVKLKCGD